MNNIPVNKDNLKFVNIKVKRTEIDNTNEDMQIINETNAEDVTATYELIAEIIYELFLEICTT